mmetsp:Transcript_10007/g.19283  ORF Transcript_10007/g.19283 Transcript_10007/m.19283 type:complete len:161 (+) Transcript_10007:212-694(+)
MGCLRCLQMVDLPTEGAGLALIYPFLTWNCIKHIVGENTENGTLGGMERFCERGALSPVLQTFFGATQINIGTTNGKDGGDCTRIPGTQTRGEIWILDLSRLCHHGSRHVLSRRVCKAQSNGWKGTTRAIAILFTSFKSAKECERARPNKRCPAFGNNGS